MRDFQGGWARACITSALAISVSFVIPISLAVAADDPVPTQLIHWTIGGDFSDEAASTTLPVLVLDQSNWLNDYTPSATWAHTWRSIQAHTWLEHPSGWSLGLVERADASIHASPDTVLLAGLNQQGKNPAQAGNYAIDVQYKFWRGKGLTLQTPKWQVSGLERLGLDAQGLDNWRMQASAQTLTLSKLRTGQMQGFAKYDGAGNYDFSLASVREGLGFAAPYVTLPDTQGWGYSLSLSLEGQWGYTQAPWRLRIAAADVLSTLRWQQQRDAAQLNSNATVRLPDGTLDYIPVLQGRRSLVQTQEHMDVDWRIRLSKQIAGVGWQGGEWYVDARRRSSLQQQWLGYAVQQRALSWQLAVDPIIKAASAKAAYSGWFMSYASDFLGSRSHLRQMQVGFSAAF